MFTARNGLVLALGLFALFYLYRWWKGSAFAPSALRRDLAPPRDVAPPAEALDRRPPTLLQVAVGVFTDFLDTLGVGSFATTTGIFKFTGMVPDRLIPGTLNVGHTLPTVVQAILFIAIVAVDPVTLLSLIAAAVAGAWLGAGVVSGWSKRAVQRGMGLALLGFTCVLLTSLLKVGPPGGTALALTAPKLAIGIAGNFALGALMTIGIGLYAPCLVMISLLGMDPLAAFPVMMGSCAFLMPIGSARFIDKACYARRPALGLMLGGIPAVLAAWYFVKSLSLVYVQWLVLCVVIYTAIVMLRGSVEVVGKGEEDYT